MNLILWQTIYVLGGIMIIRSLHRFLSLRSELSTPWKIGICRIQGGATKGKFGEAHGKRETSPFWANKKHHQKVGARTRRNRVGRTICATFKHNSVNPSSGESSAEAEYGQRNNSRTRRRKFPTKVSITSCSRSAATRF